MFFISSGFSYAQVDENVKSINKLLELQKQVKDIHPALQKLYPIAVYKDSSFKIYDFNSAENTYELTKNVHALRPVIKGIRAAFPLEENDYKMTCVVTEDAFKTPKDLSIIFHEFVHCYQLETVEYDLKDQLDIYKKEIEAKNYMWELNYPFPYGDSLIAVLYNSFIEHLNKENLTAAEKVHDELREKLGSDYYQYMIWVEWKEGCARWIENMIRERLNVEENIAGSKRDFNRVSFYYGGSNFIKQLSKQYKTKNLKDLFELIHNK
jgi:hypothetical protein